METSRSESDVERIKTLIHALRQKTKMNGCTEAEAMAAADKAAELLSRHGLTEAELVQADFDFLSERIGKRSPLERIWKATAVFADCVLLFSHDDEGRRSIMFFGRKNDLVVAEYVHSVLVAATIEAQRDFRSTETYRRRRKPRTKALAIKAFQEGFSYSVSRHLYDGLWHRYGSNAERRIPEVQNALNTLMESMAEENGFAVGGAARSLAKTNGAFRDQARWDGARAGQDVDVRAPLSRGSTPTALLK